MLKYMSICWNVSWCMYEERQTDRKRERQRETERERDRERERDKDQVWQTVRNESLSGFYCIISPNFMKC